MSVAKGSSPTAKFDTERPQFAEWDRATVLIMNRRNLFRGAAAIFAGLPGLATFVLASFAFLKQKEGSHPELQFSTLPCFDAIVSF